MQSAREIRKQKPNQIIPELVSSITAGFSESPKQMKEGITTREDKITDEKMECDPRLNPMQTVHHNRVTNHVIRKTQDKENRGKNPKYSQSQARAVVFLFKNRKYQQGERGRHRRRRHIQRSEDPYFAG
jgi:hypothetical protein